MRKFDTDGAFRKALLGGISAVAFTAVVGVSSAIAGSPIDVAGVKAWCLPGTDPVSNNCASSVGADADSVLFTGTEGVLTVGDDAAIGKNNDGVSVSAAASVVGKLVFDGAGSTDGSTVHGKIVPVDDAVISIEIGGATTGANVTFKGDVGVAGASPLAVAMTFEGEGDSVVTLDDGVTYTGGIDLSDVAKGSAVLNLKDGVTVTGNIVDKAAATSAEINVAGTVTVDGDIDLGDTAAVDDAAELNIGADSTLTFGGDVLTVNNVDLEGGGTLTLTADAAAVTADIEGEGGILNVGLSEGASVATLVGGIGTKEKAIAAINIAKDSELKISTVVGGSADRVVNATTTTLTGAGTNAGKLTIDTGAGSEGVSFLGAVSAAEGGNGTIVVNAINATTAAAAPATVTFGGDLGSSEKHIGALTVGGDPAATTTDAGSQIVVVAGNAYVDAITVAGAAAAVTGVDTLVFTGSDATVSGTINGVDIDDSAYGAGTGIVRVGKLGAAAPATATAAAEGTGTEDAAAKSATNVTFEGEIGSTYAIQKFEVADGSTANVSKNINIDTETVDNTGLYVAGTGTLNISSMADDANANVAYTVKTGKVDLGGVLSVSGNNNVTISSIANDNTAAPAGVGQIDIDGTLTTSLSGGKTLTLTADAAGGEDNDGTINIATKKDTTITAANRINLEGNTTIGGTAEGTTLTLNVGKTETFNPAAGRAIIDASGTVSVATDSKIKVALSADTDLLSDGAVIRVIDSDDSGYNTLEDDGKLELVDSFFIDLQDESTGTALNVKVVYRDKFEGVSEASSAVLKNAFTVVTTSKNEKDTALFGDFVSITKETAGGIADQLGIQADTLGAASTVVANVGATVTGIASDRLASLRTGSRYASAQQVGFASGDVGLAHSVWVKPFGSKLSQDDEGEIKGFDADTFGVAAGIDTEVIEDVRVGASLAYAATDVEGKGAGGSQLDITGYQMSLYGDYTADKYYLEGMVGFSHNKNDLSRTIAFLKDKKVTADYTSKQYTASIGGGVPINLKGSVFIVPVGSLTYTHVNPEDYTETGAEGLSHDVSLDNVNLFVAHLGTEFYAKIKQGGGFIIPSARVGASYDFAGEAAAATGTYTGGGAAFTVEGAEVEQLSGNAGIGLAYDAGIWSVGANYDAEFKSGYLGHSATIEARLRF